MKITMPSNNRITGGYNSSHKGYDFSSKPDPWVYACRDGEITQTVNHFKNSWRSLGKLTTRDYGNYIKVKHTDGTFSLYAHLPYGNGLSVNQRVKEGQKLCPIGNTGNSTGPHLHFEFRNSNNINIPVEWKISTEDSMPDIPLDIQTDANNWIKLRETIPGIETVADAVKILQLNGDIKTDSNNWNAVRKNHSIESIAELDQLITDLRLASQEQDCSRLVENAVEKAVKPLEKRIKQDKLKIDLLKKQLINEEEIPFSRLFNLLLKKVFRK